MKSGEEKYTQLNIKVSLGEVREKKQTFFF